MLSKAGVQFTTLALLGLLVRGVLAAPDDAKSRAAALFEQGVRQFSSAQYAAAAEAFLAADELVPNTRALVNGITAARRAGQHLVVARAAERAVARLDIDPGSAALAREALVEAARSLTRLDVSCSPKPCTVTLDGAAVTEGNVYVLPGTHDVGAWGTNGATATEHVSAVAGASYRVTLTPKAPEQPVSAPVATRPVPPPKPTPAPLATEPVRTKPLSPEVFYAGVAGTAALVALTTWSGIDTLNTKDDAYASRASWGDVKDRALRTDILLASAIVVGAATGAAGLWLVDWEPDRHAAAALLPGGGAGLVAEGRF